MPTSESKPLVSILMAAYNAEKTIGYAIRSVLKQTFRDWELIVINDCSVDGTEDAVRSFDDPRIRLLTNEINMGVGKTRRKGLDAARGEWIAVLDSDDMWAPEKLEKQLKLARETGAELIFTASAFVDNDGNPIDWLLHAPATISYHELLKQNLVSNSSALVTGELYRRHYTAEDDIHEDFAIWLSITREGKTAYGIDEPLLIYRLTRSSRSGNKLRAARMNWRTYRYLGLNCFEASYYMCWYAIRGLKKYRHLRY